ncbi:MAG: NUDIX domain-containing protein [Gammaproteobacteria bacterium]|nr:NUDIX domain-containing protein [Gammaproteobacteria bacterium]MDH5651894.1 NUDIX domain-containing protein [Gammaproteobacteria bacterium]
MNFCPECGSKVEAKQIDHALRFVCINNECAGIYWNNPTPVVAALVKSGGDYILARNKSWPKGIFSLITGYLEAGEEAEAAVLREVSEELGLTGEVVHYLGHHMFKEKNQLILAFEVHATGTIVPGEELAEIKQVSVGELAAYNFKPLYITEAVIAQWRRVSHQC